MLCLEGIARALNVFNKPAECAVTYSLADMAGRAPLRLTVKAETALVRPFMVAAVLRGVKFDATRYKSFIDLQVCHSPAIMCCCHGPCCLCDISEPLPRKLELPLMNQGEIKQ